MDFEVPTVPFSDELPFEGSQSCSANPLQTLRIPMLDARLPDVADTRDERANLSSRHFSSLRDMQV
jgi:hypothetical protein